MYGPSVEMNLVTGYYEAHKNGFGFVIHETPGSRDIFIPAGATLGAMNGDKVVARIENRQRRGGRVVRILERAYTRIIGTIDRTKTAIYVRPKNRFIPFDLYIAPKDVSTAVHGDIVIAEITEYPSDKRLPQAGS